MSGLDTLRERYPWPAERPEGLPGCMGWCAGENRSAFTSLLNAETQVVLELGSFEGLSSGLLCEAAPNATILCVDHWKGSAEHHKRPHWNERLAKLYDSFLMHLWEHRDRVVPMRTSTLEGMREISALGIKPDLVYVDASHDEESVFQDTTTALQLFRESIIIGDDWTKQSVRMGAVRAACRCSYFKVFGCCCWHIPVEGRKY